MLSFIQVVVTTDVGCDDYQETEERLTVMQPDGSEQRTLVASQHIQQAGWAADGSSLYYTTGSLDGLWSVGIDGSAPEQINSVDGWQEVSPSGELSEEPNTVRLDVLEPERLEAEAGAAGLAPAGRRPITPTDDHVGSIALLFSPAEPVEVVR